MTKRTQPRPVARPVPLRALVLLALLAAAAQGCQFLQNEFWTY